MHGQSGVFAPQKPLDRRLREIGISLHHFWQS
jgi:hypothetical protein